VPLIVNSDFFPSGFKLDAQKKVVYIDPVLVDGEEPADFLLITHPHSDHFSIQDIRKLIKGDTILICPVKVHKKLSCDHTGCIVKLIRPGERLDFDDISIESVAAYNIKAGIITPHPKSAMNVGYIITSQNTRIYHTGDTDYVPEMQRLKDINAVLTPIDGGNLTMTTPKAAALVNHLKPRFAVPMHYNIGTPGVEEFRHLIQSDTRVVVMDGQQRSGNAE